MRVYPEIVHKFHDLLVRVKTAIPFIGYPLHRNGNYNPFFIIGSGRSGNTLLRRILHAHSELFIPPETYVLGRIIKLFRQYSNMKWSDLVSLIYSRFQFHPEFFIFGIDSLQPLANKVSKCDKRKRSLAYIINSFYLYYAEVHNIKKQRWGDKTPINTFCLDRIYSVFPKAKFIHIIRDGCDVVYSYVNAGIYNEYTEAALRWKISVKLARKFGNKHPENYLEIRYEDLVNNPEKEIKKVCDFLEIDFEPQMINSENIADKLGDVAVRKHHANVYKPINKENIGKGRKKMSLEDKIQIDKIIGKELLQLGYKLCR